MIEFNKHKTLLSEQFVDSLGERTFNVEIKHHISNIVLGECVGVKIQHEDPSLCWNETYAVESFPGDFYDDLGRRGWSYVLEMLRDKIFAIYCPLCGEVFFVDSIPEVDSICWIEWRPEGQHSYLKEEFGHEC